MAQMKTYWKRKALAKYKSITLWYKKKIEIKRRCVETSCSRAPRGIALEPAL